MRPRIHAPIGFHRSTILLTPSIPSCQETQIPLRSVCWRACQFIRGIPKSVHIHAWYAFHYMIQSGLCRNDQVPEHRLRVYWPVLYNHPDIKPTLDPQEHGNLNLVEFISAWDWYCRCTSVSVILLKQTHSSVIHNIPEAIQGRAILMRSVMVAWEQDLSWSSRAILDRTTAWWADADRIIPDASWRISQSATRLMDLIWDQSDQFLRKYPLVRAYPTSWVNIGARHSLHNHSLAAHLYSPASQTPQNEMFSRDNNFSETHKGFCACRPEYTDRVWERLV